MALVHRIVGVVVALLLAGPAVAWVGHAVRLLTGCHTGLGNAGFTGRLDGGACVLSDPVLSDPARPLVRVPWTSDVLIAGLLVVALGCVVAALLVRRGSLWSLLLPWLAVPVLLVSGLTMGVRGRRRAEGGIFDFLVSLPGDSPEGYSAGAVPGGWELRSPDHTIGIPDVSALWLVVGFVAGLVLIGFAVTGWRLPSRNGVRSEAASPAGSGSAG